MGYIYIIKNDINNKVYIGQTKRTIEKRWEEHCKYALEEDSCSKFYLAIKEIGIEHFYIESIEEIESLEDRNYREIFWISYYDSFNNGYNSTHGGGCFEWNNVSKLEKYDKIIELREENKSYSEICKILHCGQTTIVKALRYNNLLPQEVKSRTKEIYKVDLKTGKIITKYNSLAAAAKDNNIGTNQISEVANRRAKTANGFIWCWAKDYSSLKIENHIDNKTKKVKCIENNIIFSSVVEAVKWLIKENLAPLATSANICKVCAGQRKTAYGFHWTYI